MSCVDLEGLALSSRSAKSAVTAFAANGFVVYETTGSRLWLPAFTAYAVIHWDNVALVSSDSCGSR